MFCPSYTILRIQKLGADNVALDRGSELKVRGGIENNSENNFFLFLNENICFMPQSGIKNHWKIIVFQVREK